MTGATATSGKRTQCLIIPDWPAKADTPDLQSITQLVHSFYGDVLQDPLLGPVFEKALRGRWNQHLQRLVDFWSTVALGQRSFKGDVLGQHMALEGITPAHFSAWMGLWQQHTERLFVPHVALDLQRAARGIARTLFRGYFGSGTAFGAALDSGETPSRARYRGVPET